MYTKNSVQWNVYIFPNHPLTHIFIQLIYHALTVVRQCGRHQCLFLWKLKSLGEWMTDIKLPFQQFLSKFLPLLQLCLFKSLVIIFALGIARLLFLSPPWDRKLKEKASSWLVFFSYHHSAGHITKCYQQLK